jgi:hypothetical protein
MMPAIFRWQVNCGGRDPAGLRKATDGISFRAFSADQPTIAIGVSATVGEMALTVIRPRQETLR